MLVVAGKLWRYGMAPPLVMVFLSLKPSCSSDRYISVGRAMRMRAVGEAAQRTAHMLYPERADGEEHLLVAAVAAALVPAVHSIPQGSLESFMGNILLGCTYSRETQSIRSDIA